MATTEQITVCDKCLRACCWKGIFMCDKARGAGTTERTSAQLKRLGREHSDYWDGTYERSQTGVEISGDAPAGAIDLALRAYPKAVEILRKP